MAAKTTLYGAGISKAANASYAGKVPAVPDVVVPTGIGVNTLATCNLIGQRRRSTWNTYADMAASIEEAL